MSLNYHGMSCVLNSRRCSFKSDVTILQDLLISILGETC